MGSHIRMVEDVGVGLPRQRFSPPNEAQCSRMVFGVNLVSICAGCAGFDGYAGS
jgi:hypothetical protein